jgi:FAD/FMN-containing dehydrogenase
MTNDEVRAAERDLARAMTGSVAIGGQQGYADTVSIDNGRVTLQPYLVAFPTSVKDVSTVIKYCRSNDIRMTTKSGGHSAAGYSLNNDGIVLNLTNMNTLNPVGSDRLSVGFGTRWIDLYNYIESRMRGLLAIGGGCGKVGVGGFLLGGGFSFASRSYGLASDNIKSMEFVSADGTIHHLNDKLTAKEDKDLFWALRGGGGGNFGVVTQAELQLHKTPTESMTGGQVTFPFYRIQEVLAFYNKWAPTLPDKMAVYGMLRYFPDPRRGGAPLLCVRFTPVYNGHVAEATALLQPLIDLNPISVDLYSMTLPQWENFVGAGTLVDGRPAYIRSAIMPAHSLTSDVAEICMKYMCTAPSTDSYVVWTHMGGKIRENEDVPTAFAHRDGEFAFEVKSIWNPSPMTNARTNIEWAVNFFDELEKHSQGAYLNYIDPLLVDWQQKYYRTNWDKLVKVKKHWDPKGQFDFQQGIGSDFNPTRTSPLDLSPLTRTHL